MGKSVFGKNSVSLQSRPVWTFRAGFAAFGFDVGLDFGFAATFFGLAALLLVFGFATRFFLDGFGFADALRTFARDRTGFFFALALVFNFALVFAGAFLRALALALLRFAALFVFAGAGRRLAVLRVVFFAALRLRAALAAVLPFLVFFAMDLGSRPGL